MGNLGWQNPAYRELLDLQEIIQLSLNCYSTFVALCRSCISTGIKQQGAPIEISQGNINWRDG